MSRKRLSIVELIAIIVIGCEVIWLAGNAFGWLNVHVSSGNDGSYVNTCESVAKVNSLNGTQCPVNDCSGGDCIHHTAQGYIGYFDSVSNTIVGTKPKGYNSSSTPAVDGKKYKGSVGTMVLEVIVNNGNITTEWTGGRK